MATTPCVPQTVVVDTCVILDMFLKDRPRHFAAKSLWACLTHDKTRIVIPFTGLFEGIASLTRETAHHGSLKAGNVSPEFSLIPIDDAFYMKYRKETYPPLRTGDLLFFLIAERDNCPLITEDDELYIASKAAHVRVFRIAEYVAEYGV
jgi:predicted nucleic acid-binding protein